MTFSPSCTTPGFTARYSVVRFLAHGKSYEGEVAIEGTRYVEYCDTFAEAKRRLRHHAKGMNAAPLFSWVHPPTGWYAEAVQRMNQIRQRAYVVAKATDNVTTEWLTVVKL